MLAKQIIGGISSKHDVLGAVYKGRPENGEGVVLKFWTFPDGGRGGGVCESSDVRKFLKKYFYNCFLNISQSSITVSVVLF